MNNCTYASRTLFTAVILLGYLAVLSPSTARAQQDAGWPRQIKNDDGTLLIYQPQIEDWKDYKSLTGNIAFSLTPKDGKEIHGVATFQSETTVDKENRTVYLKSISYPSIRFPSLEESDANKMQMISHKLFPTSGEPISLDRIMAEVDQQKHPPTTVQVKNDPPKIFYSASPAILLTVEGDSVLAPVSKTDLQFVVNANWDVFYEKSKKKYYLLGQQVWYTADRLQGPWTYTKTLPKDMSKLPSGENFDDVKKMVPPPATSASPQQVFYSNVPAELIVFKGAPVYTRITNTQLFYVTNTDNDIFLYDATKVFYVLLSGRWFAAQDLNGPWSYAGDKLPADFTKIPENSPKGNVLASIPGTIEASDAVMLAQIPTTAVVNKKDVESKVKVTYDGTPDFKKIDGTTLDYATNTQEKVIKYGDMYYLCFQAVWFMSTTPTGPWKVCDIVPDEIYKIPADSPMYNVTYVKQTNATETTVESSTGAGYFGAFIIGVGIGACIAYGTGWYHPPYFFYPPGRLYPIYRPWPATYGAGFTYNPWTGGFAGGRSVYGPYGAAGTAAWYNPATGRYGRSASVQGLYGGRTAAHAYNPWTGAYTSTRQGHNAYAQWGSSVTTRGNQWVQTGHVTTARGTTAGYNTSTGQHGVIHTGPGGTVVKNPNNTYVGHDGNIYKKNASGNWSQYSNGSWKQGVGGEGSTQHQLNTSEQQRQRGQQQQQRFQQYKQNNERSFNRGNLGGSRGGGLKRR
ncbi:MAG: hypothetical protein J0I41_21035 [Filimonas sp.]|nr:hypothetical protein [Filimonas sp.]